MCNLTFAMFIVYYKQMHYTQYKNVKINLSGAQVRIMYILIHNPYNNLVSLYIKNFDVSIIFMSLMLI